MSRASMMFVLLAVACTREVEVVYDSSRFSADERAAIESIAESAVRDVRRCLPALPRPITLRVSVGDRVIEETGETGTTTRPAIVYWTVDAERGIAEIAKKQLRATLFHELHHLVRASKIPRRTLLDEAITEGLATAFERDHGGGVVPWGEVPPEIGDWLTELRALPNEADRSEWLYRHPDGRRWIAFKVGTYVVDRAQRLSKQGPCELVTSTTEEILKLASID